jgi:G3E family GTPase
MLRYKGVLNLAGQDQRMIFQGVHMTMGGSPGKAWAADEKRESKMVFIGRNLPKRIFVEGLAYCVADSENAVIEVK